jgi:phage terminase small subunit
MPRKSPQELTDRQERFVAEYLRDLNGTAAAIRAGYAAGSARFKASKLLANVAIQEAIAKAKKERARRMNISAGRVLRELVLVGFSDIGELIDFSGDVPHIRPANEITSRARRALSSVKVRRVWEKDGDDKVAVDLIEFRLWDKVGALKELLRHLTDESQKAKDEDLTDEQIVARLRALLGEPPGESAAGTAAGDRRAPEEDGDEDNVEGTGGPPATGL